jgi:DNA-binding transcriptional ArsR family regulator
METIETLSDIFKALGDPTRLRLLQLLTNQSVVFCGGDCNGETFLCVGALANKLAVTQSAVSQHLRILRQAGLVRGERRGTFMHYSISRQGLERYRSLVAETMGDQFSSG